MAEIPTLEGQLTRLEPLQQAHGDVLFALVSGYQDRFPWTFVPTTRAEMESYVEAALAMHRDSGALPFVTVRRADGAIVGSTRLFNSEFWSWPAGSAPPRVPGAPDATEIGWTWLHPSAQRTGLNTEAKLLQLTYAFETWQVRRVTFRTDERNAQSRAAIERVGATLDGVLRHHMPAARGGVRNSAIFSILDSEWPAVRERLQTRRA